MDSDELKYLLVKDIMESTQMPHNSKEVLRLAQEYYEWIWGVNKKFKKHCDEEE